MALASASEVMLENFALLPSSSLEDDHFRVTRAAKKKCPPVKVQNGFSPFAFLAFILISINTIMNISNNISNNNNNRNNNNNDNNNNNLFSSNNVNMRRSFDFVPDSGKNNLNFYPLLFCICWYIYRVWVDWSFAKWNYFSLESKTVWNSATKWRRKSKEDFKSSSVDASMVIFSRQSFSTMFSQLFLSTLKHVSMVTILEFISFLEFFLEILFFYSLACNSCLFFRSEGNCESLECPLYEDLWNKV